MNQDICKLLDDCEQAHTLQEREQILGHIRDLALRGEVVCTDEQRCRGQRLNQDIEYQSEMQWAKKMLETSHIDRNILQIYPYYTAYVQLLKHDQELLQQCGCHTHHMKGVFLGGGPLPLTALMFAYDYGISFDVIEYQEEAAHVAQQLVAKLGVSDRITIRCMDASALHDYSPYDVVYISSFLSYQPDVVVRVIDAIAQTNSSAHIFARSVGKDAEILYKPLPTETSASLLPIAQRSRSRTSLNSVGLYRIHPTYCTMHHHHTIPHTHEHPICVATIIYNILVLIAEVGILFAFTHTDVHELAAYEWTLQIIHLLGTALLGVLTWYLTHALAHRTVKPGQSQLSTKLQTTAGFFSISTLMLIAHIVLLHVVPRLIGFSLHEHDEHQSEIVEYAILASIIIFVTIAFRYRDTVLQHLGWKNRITIPQPMFLRRWSQRLAHHHHAHHHHHHTTHE